ncbi:hypothetical protein [Candidatus Borrarchaeum sp.]|uniref:hypothetical protein n=1 Tax=Candidatus Borrarchaeum sp. TaxID=2846742 RepID=UPI00257F699A|nr:hypothetical protein [Candidatus Borrarchaeum sp.]
MGLYSIYIIYKDGRTIYSCSLCKEYMNGVDQDLVSGALSGISSLISEVVSSGNGQLEQIDSGDTKFVFEWGENHNFIVVALSDVLTSPILLEEDISTAAKLISIKYSQVLDDWSGDISDFEKIENFLMLCFEKTLRETFRPICRIPITQEVNTKKLAKLSREEWALLESCNGNKSIYEIANEHKMSRIELFTRLNKPLAGLVKKEILKIFYGVRRKIAEQFING